MGNLQPAVKDDFKFISLESTTKKINETMDKVKNDFMYIGFLLWEVNHFKYYESKGYCSVVEYAEKELGFKQSSTYNFISICEKFSAKKESGYPTMQLDQKFKDYNFTQLVEIKSLNVEQLKSINSNMSKKQIREKKKELKKELENNVIDVEFKTDIVMPGMSEIKTKLIDSVIDENIYKDNVIKYLVVRMEVLKDLVKSQKKKESNDYYEFKGALHEVDLLLDCIKNDEV